jgi:hypothetical protein
LAVDFFNFINFFNSNGILNHFIIIINFNLKKKQLAHPHATPVTQRSSAPQVTQRSNAPQVTQKAELQSRLQAARQLLPNLQEEAAKTNLEGRAEEVHFILKARILEVW